MSRYNSLSQQTRASREAYVPEGGEQATKGPKLSAQSFSAQGLQAGAVASNGMTVAESRQTGGAMESLKDRRVGGLFAKGSVKDNWRADGGLAFPSQAKDAISAASQTDSTNFLTQGDVIRGAARGGTKTEIASTPTEFSAKPLEERASLLGKPLDAGVKSKGFAATLMDPLDPYGTFDSARKEDFTLALPSEQTDGDGGFARRLDDFVFNGDMSNEDRQYVMRVVGRTRGLRGVLQ